MSSSTIKGNHTVSKFKTAVTMKNEAESSKSCSFRAACVKMKAVSYMKGNDTSKKNNL